MLGATRVSRPTPGAPSLLEVLPPFVLTPLVALPLAVLPLALAVPSPGGRNSSY